MSGRLSGYADFRISEMSLESHHSWPCLVWVKGSLVGLHAVPRWSTSDKRRLSLLRTRVTPWANSKGSAKPLFARHMVTGFSGSRLGRVGVVQCYPPQVGTGGTSRFATSPVQPLAART